MSNSLSDPLPSWHEGKVKQRIIDVVQQIVHQESESLSIEKNHIVRFGNSYEDVDMKQDWKYIFAFEHQERENNL